MTARYVGVVRFSPCGCRVSGGGIDGDPLAVVHCRMHALAPEMRAWIDRMVTEVDFALQSQWSEAMPERVWQALVKRRDEARAILARLDNA